MRSKDDFETIQNNETLLLTLSIKYKIIDWLT